MKEGFDSPTGYKHKSRDGAVVARRAHNPKVTGSSPVPATKKSQSIDWLFAFLEVLKVYFQKRIGMQKGRTRSGLSFS